jgi:DNA-binding transcriptional ArsR family regulator
MIKITLLLALILPQWGWCTKLIDNEPTPLEQYYVNAQLKEAMDRFMGALEARERREALSNLPKHIKDTVADLDAKMYEIKCRLSEIALDQATLNKVRPGGYKHMLESLNQEQEKLMSHRDQVLVERDKTLSFKGTLEEFKAAIQIWEKRDD